MRNKFSKTKTKKLRELGLRLDKIQGKAVSPAVWVPTKIKLKRRAIYFYKCEDCGKKRFSRIYIRAMGKQCRKCTPKPKVDDRQLSIF